MNRKPKWYRAPTTDVDGYPVVYARRTKFDDETDLLRFWCDYCHGYHQHSAEDGHRVAHCWNPKSPYKDRGYIVRSIDKGRSKKDARHIRLHHSVLQSPAWRSLSGDAVKLLLAVWERRDGTDNGQISMSERDAERLVGRSRNTIRKAFRELEDKGFLRAHNRGSFDHKSRQATLWEVTLTALGEPKDESDGFICGPMGCWLENAKSESMPTQIEEGRE